jgi:hypothetical protein
MEKSGLTRQRIVAELSRSPHGKLSEYVGIGKAAVEQEGEFFAHLIAWDRTNGQIRDSKVALPVIGLAFQNEPEFVDNSLAHLALLAPRELSRAYRFALELRPKGKMRQIRRGVEAYLREKEEDKGWDRIAVQHRGTLKELYALAHVKPSSHADDILFKGVRPKGSVFEAIANLKNMTPTEAAGTIMRYRIPFLVAKGALGEKAKNTDLVVALIDRMTPTELVTNTKMLESLGMKNDPAIRGAYDKALEKAATSKKNTLKTTKAAEAVKDDSLREKLRGLQEKQIQSLKGPEGNWLVLADRSSSMNRAIEMSRHVAATLAKMVKGKVYLVFFDTSPIFVDVTGLSLDKIQAATKHINARGCTSIGCGLNRILADKIEVDGIAIVSDGEENTPPMFADVYKKYSSFVGKDVPVYLYHCDGGSNHFSNEMNRAGIEMQTFDVRHAMDYYSIPNLAQTMRENQYSLADEIFQTPLLTLSDVLKYEKGLVAA